MVHAVVGIGRSDLAGADAAQLVGTADALEIDVVEIRARRIRQSADARYVVTIRDANAGKAAFERIGRKYSTAVAVGYIVQQIVLAQRIEKRYQVRTRQDRRFARLIVIEARGI